jgi:predicted Zn-dependent protease
LGQQIVEQTPLADLYWTFDVAATPIPNALCTGEGFVVVTEGLLSLNLTDDELAGVLGHEVAHGVRRHSQLFEERYLEAKRLLGELKSLEREAANAEAANDNHRLQTIRSRVTAMEPRLMFLADFVKNQQAYDQHEEEEADIQGMHYAASAGFDPNGEGRALVKLRARSIELFGQAYQEGSRTHPPLKRRLEIQSLVQKRWHAQRDRPR